MWWAARLFQRGVCDSFIATPRIRVRINGVEHEVVSSAESVLERNYSRPDHQTAYVATGGARRSTTPG